MLNLSCLDRAPGPAESLLLAEGLYFTLVAILLLALIGAALAAPLVQRGYRRRVVRLMRFDQVSPRPPQWWLSRTRARSANLEKVRAVSGDGGLQLSDLVLRRERRVAVSTAMAWLVFVIAAVPIGHWMLAEAPVSEQGYFVVGAGALALGPAFINLPHRYARQALVIGLAVCVIAAVLIDSLTAPVSPVIAPEVDIDDPGVVEWTIAVVAAALGYMSIFHRRLRGLVLPVFVVAAVALMLLLIPLGYVQPHLGSCLDEASAPGHTGQSATFLLALSTLMALAVWLGFKALDGLAKLVDVGWLSELSLIGVVSLALIAMTLVAASLADQSAPSHWLAWLPLPWTGVAVGAYGLSLGRNVTSRGPRLLVLRVFARGRKQLRLLDALQSRWRYVGPVHQIGGPDLATTNVDPHECSLFLVGRLHDLFVPEAVSAAQLSDRLTADADREGRYSISEVFCFNSAWQHTVEQLMQLSDAILLDLRGLTAERRGTSYELRALARTGLLDRVVAIGDKQTDWALADRLLIEAGQEPQRLAHRFVGSELRAEVIFDQLLRVTDKPVSPQSLAA